ncbi:MAG TPA: glycosyltransferase 87 family protein [Candidatus Thermoplasmatota archaeon]
MNVHGALARASAAFPSFVVGDRQLLRLLVVALSLRLVLLPWFSDPYNFRVFWLTASMVEADHNPWVLIASDPALSAVNPWGYPPLYLTPVLAASALSLGNGLAFGVLIRLPLIAASLLTAVLVQRTGLALGLGERRARAAAALYALNPFVLLVDTVWGANDPLPVACVAAALYFSVRNPPRRDLAALALGVGVAFKLYPIVLLPVALGALPSWRARARFLALATLPGALSAGPLLLASPSQLLEILGVFVVSGSNAPQPLTVAYLLVGPTGTAGAITPALVASFLVAVLAVAFLHARGRGTPLGVWAVSLLLVFLAAPRLGENYFLWPVHATTLCAALLPWQRLSQAAGTLLWLPPMASALIYNGAGGITGFSYWGLTSGAPSWKLYALVPPETRLLLTAMVVAMLTVAVAGLLRAASVAARPAPPTDLRPFLSRLGGSLPGAKATMAAGVLALLLSAPLVETFEQPLRPEDFGNYGYPEGQVRYTEEFQSAILDQTWTFGGAGAFVLEPAGRGILALDTRVPRGNAYITRLVPNTTLDVAMAVRVDRVDGSPGLILLARIPPGWIGVQNIAAAPATPSHRLVFFDERTNTSNRLGSVDLGEWFSLGFTLSANHTDVRFGNASHRTAGGVPTHLVFGQRDVGANLGGRASLDAIVISWEAPPDARAPGLYAALLALGVATLAIPAVWWRKRPS